MNTNSVVTDSGKAPSEYIGPKMIRIESGNYYQTKDGVWMRLNSRTQKGFPVKSAKLIRELSQMTVPKTDKAEIDEAVNLIDWHNEHGIENMTLDQQYRLDELLEKWIHLRDYVRNPNMNTDTPNNRYFAKDCRVIDRETGAIIRTNHPTDFGLEATIHRIKRAQHITRNDVKFWNRNSTR